MAIFSTHPLSPFADIIYEWSLWWNLESSRSSFDAARACSLDTIQKFLIKLDIKPLLHLLEISIFSLNNDLIRLTKIMNNLVKDLKILSFKIIFQYLKLVKSFQKKIHATKVTKISKNKRRKYGMIKTLLSNLRIRLWLEK